MGAYGWLSLGGRDVENEGFMVEGMGLQDEGFMVEGMGFEGRIGEVMG